MKKKIHIIGRGLDPDKHLTLDAVRALQKSDMIIGIEPEEATWLKLSKEFQFPIVKDISRLYKNGHQDLDNYQRYIDYIAELSQHYSTISLLVAGHHRLGVSFITLRCDDPRFSSFEIESIDGISSFAVMTNDLNFDPLERGTGLLDANRLLLFDFALEPAYNYFIYHICSVATPKTNFANPSESNKLWLLQEFLLKYYSPEKEMHLVKASNGSIDQANRITFKLQNMQDINDQVSFSSTLFIPAENPSRFNKTIFNYLRFTT